MLDSIYRMTLKFLNNHIFGFETSRFLTFKWTSGLSVLLHGVKPLPVTS